MKIANRYIGQHLDDSNEFEVFKNIDQSNLLRAKISSRFSKTRKHQEFENNCKPSKSEGHYWQCKMGSRTVGCCSHIIVIGSLPRNIPLCTQNKKKNKKLDHAILNAAKLLASTNTEVESKVSK